METFHSQGLPPSILHLPTSFKDVICVIGKSGLGGNVSTALCSGHLFPAPQRSALHNVKSSNRLPDKEAHEMLKPEGKA